MGFVQKMSDEKHLLSVAVTAQLTGAHVAPAPSNLSVCEL